MLVALVYTTPWDAYLVRESIWWYGPERVLATLFGVPAEEYAFFVLQTVLMGLVTVGAVHAAVARRDPIPSGFAFDPSPAARRTRRRGALLFLAAALAGAACLQFDATRYLGLIVAWASPVLALIWGVAGDRIRPLGSGLVLPIALVTGYLWVADRFAIGDGIWVISERFTVGWAPFGLPVEEALFFLATNLMVALGLSAYLLAARTTDGSSVPNDRHASRAAARVG